MSDEEQAKPAFVEADRNLKMQTVTLAAKEKGLDINNAKVSIDQHGVIRFFETREAVEQFVNQLPEANTRRNLNPSATSTQ